MFCCCSFKVTLTIEKTADLLFINSPFFIFVMMTNDELQSEFQSSWTGNWEKRFLFLVKLDIQRLILHSSAENNSTMFLLINLDFD